MRGDRARWNAPPALLLALALALAGLVEAWNLGRRSAGLDFYQFWVVAQVAGRDDVPDLYAEEARARVGAEFVQRSVTDEDSERRRAAAGPWQVLEPTATPLLYTAFRPLASGTYEDDYRAFSLLSLAAGVAGLLVMARLAGHSWTVALLALALVAHAFQPLKADIRVGNVNQLQLAGLALFLWLSARADRPPLQVGAGAALGLLVVFKPNLLPVVPVLCACWLLDGRRRKLALQAAGLGAGVLCGALLPLLTFGTLEAWPQWSTYLRSLPPEKIPLRYGNMGLARLLMEATGLDLAIPLGLAALGATGAALWIGRSRNGPSPGPGPRTDTEAVAAGALVYLLSAPMVWLHYLLLAVPAGLVLLSDQDGRGGGGRRLLAAAALVAIAVDPVADAVGMRRLEHQALMTSAGLLALFALLCARLARPPRLLAAGREPTISAEASA